MTQKYDSNTGAKFIADSTLIPTETTYDAREGVLNRHTDRALKLEFDTIATTSGDNLIEFVAPDNGKITFVELVNGTVAADGSNGLELNFINKTNSDAVLAYVGFGSGTEADKATDKDAAVAAQEVATVAVTSILRCNKDDKVSCTIDRDGTTIVGQIVVYYEVSTEGR